MATRDLIVIGASSGGVEALSKVVSGLPEDLAAAIFVVLHVPEGRESQLPAILNRAGRLPAAHAVDREPIRRGRIYVAPPGLQTYVQRGRISLRRGPAENLHRPSVDALFRTAAHYYGDRVIGVVLSGALDDGSAGLAAVKRGGGVAIVQEPSDAKVPDMPNHAAERADPDYVMPADDIPQLLAALVGIDESPRLSGEVPLETVEEAADPMEALRSNQLGQPAEFSCPDCGGTLYEIEDGPRLRFRCRVGHAYSQDAMVEAQTASVERALWTALRALEERSGLLNKMADYSRRHGHSRVAALFVEKSQQVEEDVKAIHEVITNGGTLASAGHDGA